MGIVSCNVFVEVFGSLVSTYRLFVVGTCHRSRPPSSQIASAVQSDCVRHPIRLRPPSDQVAFGERWQNINNYRVNVEVIVCEHTTFTI